MWPRRRWWVAGAPVLITALFLTDAFFLHHRIAVTMRTSAVFFDSKIIEGILPSPSGRSTAYIVGDHWLASFYGVYMSAPGSLFPRHEPISRAENLCYPRDIHAAWTGPFFTAGPAFPPGQPLNYYPQALAESYTAEFHTPPPPQLLTLGFDERTGQAHTLWQWQSGPRHIGDFVKKSLKAFHEHLEALRLQAEGNASK